MSGSSGGNSTAPAAAAAAATAALAAALGYATYTASGRTTGQTPSAQRVGTLSSLALEASPSKVGGAHVDTTAEALRAALQGSGNQGAVVSILEHGLQVLDMLSMSTPRKKRKAIEQMCARIDEILEADQCLLATTEATELSILSGCLCAVQDLKVGEADASCLGILSKALDTVARCGDRVLASTQQLLSKDTSQRKRGLAMLSRLARQPLASVSLTEISAAEVVSGLLKNDSSDDMGVVEQTLALLSLFAFGIRNGPEASVAVYTQPISVVYN